MLNINHDAGEQNALGTQGYQILRRALAPERIALLNGELDPVFASTAFCRGDFYGERTKRFGGLLKRSAVAAELVLHAEILALVEQALEPWCDTIQLNLTQAVEIHPGAPAQFPHRDQDMWRGETGRIEYLVNVMWPLTPFRAENGATLIWPGSHGPGALLPPPEAPPIPVEAEPGDAILFLGSTLHGGGANISDTARRGIIISYCLGWLKPYENQWLVYPPAVARGFPPELRGLVGYRQHRPNLGNVEGQCPSLLLNEGLGDAAVDALRPDQAAALAAYMAAKRPGPAQQLLP